MSEQVTRATDLTGTLVLKHDRLFLITDAFGDIRTDQRGLGLYTGDTRVLSRLELRIDGHRPLVLRTGTGAGYAGTIQMTNPDLTRNPLEKGDASATLARQSLGIVRERRVVDGLDERVRIHNYTMHVDRCLLTLTLDADFADIFEVRGVRRPARGERAPAEVDAQEVLFTYRGLDDRLRRTRVELSEPGARLDTDAPPDAGPSSEVTLGFRWTIRPGEDRSLSLRVTSEVVEDRPAVTRRRVARKATITPNDPEAAHRAWRATSTSVTSSHAGVERALRRSMADLRLLVVRAPEGRAIHRRGYPLVRHALRAGFHHLRAPAVVHQAPGRQRHALDPGAPPGDHDRRLAGCGARQDPPRAANRGDGAREQSPHTPTTERSTRRRFS